jgi:hypothetical protein
MNSATIDLLGLEPLQKGIVDEATKAEQLITALTPLFGIDSTTGRVAIPNVKAITTAFTTILGPASGPLAEGFVAMLRDGFALLPSPAPAPIPAAAGGHIASPPDPHRERLAGGSAGKPFPIPWRALSHTSTVPYPVQTSQVITPCPAMPARLPRDPVIPKDPDDPTPDPGATEPEGAGDSDPVAARDVRLVSNSVSCLANGHWSIEWATVSAGGVWPFSPAKITLPLGPKVRLGHACADTLEDALLAELGGDILSELAALITAGSGAEALKAVGGWAGLAVFHLCVHWGWLIQAKKGPNGVDLIRFFPWISPFFGGALNGYAVGF